MSHIRITAPEAPKGRWRGPADIVFVDGVADVDTDKYPTMAAYARRHGYQIEPTAGPSAEAENPETVQVTETDMSKFTKADLQAHATANGIPFDSTMTKADLLALIGVSDPAQTESATGPAVDDPKTFVG